MNDTPQAVLEFWFGDALESDEQAASRAEVWFSSNSGFDHEIERRFGGLPERALAGELDHWRDDALSCLALVLAVDQFPRNLFRGSAKAFTFDGVACDVACEAIERGFDRALHPLQATFFYLPLEHAENVAHQERCVALFEALEECAPSALRPQIEQFTGYAKRHREVVRRFGRFPHRNAVLGRSSVAEEVEFLTGGGDTFG